MRAAVAIASCLFLWGCGSSSSERETLLDVRQLSAGAKQALAGSFSPSFGGGAQFKWMPVLTTHTEDSKWLPSLSTPKLPSIGYCALVSENGGAYRVFAATIAQGPSGEYDHGKVEGVEGAGSAGGGVRERCKTLGYADFAVAS